MTNSNYQGKTEDRSAARPPGRVRDNCLPTGPLGPAQDNEDAGPG